MAGEVNGIYFKSEKAAEEFEDLLESARMPHVADKLADTFEDVSDQYDADDQEDDRTITRDEFVSSFAPAFPVDEVKKPESEYANRETAGKIFDKIQEKYSQGVDLEHVVPLWKMTVEGTGLPPDLKSKLTALLNASWILVEQKPLTVPGIGTIGEISVVRRSVPKGAELPGLQLDDGDKGAFRTVHRLRAVMTLDTSRFKLSLDELVTLVSQVDLYDQVLVLSRPGKKIPSALNCNSLYYSTFSIPNYPSNGYDVICMEPPAKDASGKYIRNGSGVVQMNWTTRGPNGEDLNRQSDKLGDRPSNEADTWGEWQFWEKQGKITAVYGAILDMPSVPGANGGTGSAGTGLMDALSGKVINDTTSSLLNDVVKMGIAFEAVKSRLEAKRKIDADVAQKAAEAAQAKLEKETPSNLEANTKALDDAKAKVTDLTKPIGFDAIKGAFLGFYKPLKAKELPEILKAIDLKFPAPK